MPAFANTTTLAETLKPQKQNKVKLFSVFKKETSKTCYKCSCCGRTYDELPLCFGSEFPDCYFSVPVEEREKRIELTESLCVVDETHFFHRGRLTIPIIDHKDNLTFDIWTSISADNFTKRMDLWEDPNRIYAEPYFGWIQTMVPTYGDTLNIKSKAIEQNVGIIPEIKAIEELHQLTADQENGITYERAVQIVEEILKQEHNKN